MNIFVPNEVLFDVIKYLSAEDFEKCQLINKKWNNLVLAVSEKDRPLYYFY